MLFFIYIGVIWIMNFPTGGFYVQRLLSTRNEREATKAFLWYNFANYVLRSWPWIVVGMLAMVYFPDLANAENGYPMAISKFLPVGLKGLMVASFLAAFMSTMSTQLNWGTSYVAHDLYEAFINPKASRKNIILVSRICMVGFTLLAAIVATKLSGILNAYKFLMQFWAGSGLILIFRWYWWRITAGAEIICLSTIALFIFLLNWQVGSGADAHLLAQGFYDFVQNIIGLGHVTDPDDVERIHWATRMFVFTFVPPLIWAPYAILSTREPSEAAKNFYKKIRISSKGWKRVEAETGLPAPKGEVAMNLLGWAVTAVALYSALLGTGSLIFHFWKEAAIFLPLAAVSGWGTWKIMTHSLFSGMRADTAAAEEQDA
jgi:SSS family solute:Na+ symporter